MTEKRYTIFGEWHKDCVIDEIRDDTGEYVTIGKVVDLLNDLSEENELLKIRFNEEREKALKFCRNIDTLTIKNEQLKQRNTNQYNQLNELWQLIEAKDWETLTAMDNQMKEDEEQLQKEWKCYE